MRQDASVLPRYQHGGGLYARRMLKKARKVSATRKRTARAAVRRVIPPIGGWTARDAISV